jgi:nucleoside 2-deoxyribosyltransferase
MKKIYIAGPDVFELDSIELGKNLVALCEKYGFEGLYPLDNIVDFSQKKQKIAHDIYNANVAMIDKADIVIANLNTFRGKEADSGTVWECGYAYAKGKSVYGYMSSKRDYIQTFTNTKEINGFVVDEDEKIIEDFAHPINLMIACSVKEIVEGQFEDVLKKIQG